MKKIAAVLALLAAATFVTTPAFAQIAGFNGTWTLNQTASEGPKAACEYLHYQVTADEEHYIVDEMSKEGEPFHTEYRAKFDGKEYANKNLVTGATNYVKLRKVFDRTEQLTNIRREKGADGKEVSKVGGHYIRVLAPDGKSITSTLINAEGQVTAVRVFDKVDYKGTRPTCQKAPAKT
jgi:hypothetical protein